MHCGSEQSGVGIEDHGHRHRRDQVRHRLLGTKRVHEDSGLERRQDLRCDPAADIDARGRDAPERDVPGFSAVRGYEQVERFGAGVAPALHGGFG